MVDGGPKKDEFAALLGIEVTRRGPGHTVAVLTTKEQHANPHGTVHGAVFYAVAGAAVAAAANDAEHSGHHHLGPRRVPAPAAIGDELFAEVERDGLDRARGHLHRHRAPGRGRRPAGLGPGPGHPAITPGLIETADPLSGPSSCLWPNLWAPCH